MNDTNPITLKANEYRYKYFWCILLLSIIFLSSSGMAQMKDSSVTSNKMTGANLTYKIINGINSGFGYDIYQGGRLTIHQPTIPALPGNKGFNSQADAQKVAQLVIKKIQNGEMPPTVSIPEMKKLRVL